MAKFKGRRSLAEGAEGAKGAEGAEGAGPHKVPDGVKVSRGGGHVKVPTVSRCRIIF
ncbi:hypothetical protein HPP92_006136 [Vanilla planifolia]|uniref:Uncharacterized protein n=1 Tax=Vanilla planifolia TaxID=51239 RepID=A0A835VDV1_VANPL|nr:hypothetical protein HPP92_006136 [Vanilla planifolia]